MTATNNSDICAPQIASRKYEVLRANALGDINQATEFIFFLQNGMNAWFSAFQTHRFACRNIHKKTSPVFVNNDVDISEVGLVAILADAILQSAQTADYRRNHELINATTQ